MQTEMWKRLVMTCYSRLFEHGVKLANWTGRRLVLMRGLDPDLDLKALLISHFEACLADGGDPSKFSGNVQQLIKRWKRPTEKMNEDGRVGMIVRTNQKPSPVMPNKDALTAEANMLVDASVFEVLDADKAEVAAAVQTLKDKKAAKKRRKPVKKAANKSPKKAKKTAKARK